jgi:hypothetical protein
MATFVASRSRPLNIVQARDMLCRQLHLSWSLAMPRRFRSVLRASLAFAFLAGGIADAATVDDLAWLSGCWAIDGADAGSIEAWLSPAGGTLLGVSRTVKGGKTVAYEFVQIRALDDGVLAYIAKPSNQAEATFPLARMGKQEVVFENKAHDFPQRIIYRLAEPGVLQARIEGTRGGKERAIDYPMKKIACAGS